MIVKYLVFEKNTIRHLIQEKHQVTGKAVRTQTGELQNYEEQP